jgi:hypothetical protein
MAVGGSYTALKQMPGLVQVPPATVDSLAYGKDSMAKQDYQGLEHNLPVWGMKVDCKGCEAAVIVSAKQLINDPNRHPLIIIIVEITLRYTEVRGGVGVDACYV